MTDLPNPADPLGRTSRLPNFYRRPLAERAALVAQSAGLSPQARLTISSACAARSDG